MYSVQYRNVKSESLFKSVFNLLLFLIENCSCIKSESDFVHGFLMILIRYY